ncbi:Plexin domain-containing protein 2 [Taenia crassiceps]|uniref:Plexin domain-containing protein 2 n=1 Tax=Taenia crassiceps TaxID=6207 RepID=A0ABR4QMT3_9CEST
MFHGYPTQELLLATGGFLYLGNVHHDQLTYSQYIAPLMADFDASQNRGISMITYTSTCEFTFSVCLFKNGSIVFAYDKIPHLRLQNGKLQGCPAVNTTPPTDTSGAIEWNGEKRRSSQRDVIVGISDAYLYEGADRRRIAEYATMNIPLQLIRSGTTITLTPLPTCVEQTTCTDCLGGKVQGFRCQWCPQIRFCSSGVDRDWQRWHENGCHLSVSPPPLYLSVLINFVL